jgi:hypothetical protein
MDLAEVKTQLLYESRVGTKAAHLLNHITLVEELYGSLHCKAKMDTIVEEWLREHEQEKQELLKFAIDKPFKKSRSCGTVDCNFAPALNGGL